MNADPLPYIPDSQVYADLLGLILRDFPEAHGGWLRTYDGWRMRYNQKCSELGHHGQEIQPIEGDPERFIEFCRQNGRRGTPHDLWRWAQHEAFRRAEQLRELQAQADYDPYSFEAVD